MIADGPQVARRGMHGLPTLPALAGQRVELSQMIRAHSLTDDGVFPQLPQSVSEQGDGATNVPIQSICPVRVVSHVQDLADAVAYAVVVDAFTHPGPADPSRIDRSVCGQLFLPGVTLDSFVIHLATGSATLYTYSTGIAYPTVHREPPLRCYARTEGCT